MCANSIDFGDLSHPNCLAFQPEDQPAQRRVVIVSLDADLLKKTDLDGRGLEALQDPGPLLRHFPCLGIVEGNHFRDFRGSPGGVDVQNEALAQREGRGQLQRYDLHFHPLTDSDLVQRRAHN